MGHDRCLGQGRGAGIVHGLQGTDRQPGVGCLIPGRLGREHDLGHHAGRTDGARPEVMNSCGGGRTGGGPSRAGARTSVHPEQAQDQHEGAQNGSKGGPAGQGAAGGGHSSDSVVFPPSVVDSTVEPTTSSASVLSLIHI